MAYCVVFNFPRFRLSRPCWSTSDASRSTTKTPNFIRNLTPMLGPRQNHRMMKGSCAR